MAPEAEPRRRIGRRERLPLPFARLFLAGLSQAESGGRSQKGACPTAVRQVPEVTEWRNALDSRNSHFSYLSGNGVPLFVFNSGRFPGIREPDCTGCSRSFHGGWIWRGCAARLVPWGLRQVGTPPAAGYRPVCRHRRPGGHVAIGIIAMATGWSDRTLFSTLSRSCLF